MQKNYILLEEQRKPLIKQRKKLANELIDLKKLMDEAKREVAVSYSELKILKPDETTEFHKYE